MKLATLTAFVFAVLVCGSAMGCSSGRTSGPDSGGPRIDGGGGGGVDAPFTPIDSPPPRPDTPIATVDAPPPRPDSGTGPRTCVATCTTDSQCAVSCPANPLGANCCDTTMHRCYMATVAVCPATAPSDGGGMVY